MAEGRACLRDVILETNDVWAAEDYARIAGYLAMRGNCVDRLSVDVGRPVEGVGTALLAPPTSAAASRRTGAA